MLKIEKKLIAFAEKNIFVLSVLLLTAIAFLMRRWGIWYHSQDYIHYFDMHEGNIQSAFYWLVVRLMGYGFKLPIHGIKWLAGIADFMVAILVVLLCKEVEWKCCNTHHKMKLLFLYAGCLFAPVVYLRGCIWAQVDSVAAAFLLGALYLWQGRFHKKNTPMFMVAAVILVGLGIAMYPIAMAAVLVYLFSGKRLYERKNIVALLLIGLVAFVWSGICGMLLSQGWAVGVQSLLRWMTCHPYTGEFYTCAAEWLWQMFLLCGYGLALYSGVAAFRKKLPYAFAVAVQLVVAICYGGMLGW